MANIIGQTTIDEVQMIEVDGDPSTGGGTAANVGSIAILGTHADGKLWLKTSSSNSSWAIVHRAPDSTTLSQGSVPFADANGYLTQNNANLFWDNTNNRLGIGIAAPQSRIHIDSGTGVGSHVRFTAGTTTGQTSTDGLEIGIDASGNGELKQRESLPINILTNNAQVACFTSGAQLLLGNTSSPIDITGASAYPQFQIIGTSSVQMAGIQYSADSVGPVFNLLKSRGASIATQGLVSSGDEFGRIQFRASDGVNFQAGASIRAYVDGTAAANSMPGKLSFQTTLSGSTTPTERMSIDNTGYITIPGILRTNRRVCDLTTQASANTTTSFTSTSTSVQQFTGSTAGQIIKLPDATTLTVGEMYFVWNDTTVTMTVQDNSGTVLESCISGAYCTFLCTNTSTAAGTWTHRTLMEPVAQEVNATSSTTTTSATDVLINGMTITPSIPGTYLVMFSTTLQQNTNNATVTVSLYGNGSQITGSERSAIPQFQGGVTPSLNINAPIMVQALVTVNGSQAIEARWRRSAGTATALARALTITRVG